MPSSLTNPCDPKIPGFTVVWSCFTTYKFNKHKPVYTMYIVVEKVNKNLIQIDVDAFTVIL